MPCPSTIYQNRLYNCELSYLKILPLALVVVSWFSGTIYQESEFCFNQIYYAERQHKTQESLP